MKITNGKWEVKGNKVLCLGRGTIAICPSPSTEGTMEFINNVKFISFAPKMAETLKEIAEGKGRFSLDPMTHCSNTVEDMKKLATDLLAEMEVE